MLSEAKFASYGEAYKRIVEDSARPDPDGIVLEIAYTWGLARKHGHSRT